MQHKLVRTAWNQEKDTVLMWEDALVGRPRKVHIDCENTTYSSGPHGDRCLWPKYTDVTGPRFRWDEAAVQLGAPLDLKLPSQPIETPPGSPGGLHYEHRESVNFGRSYIASAKRPKTETGR